jgi:hypothetical protein
MLRAIDSPSVWSGSLIRHRLFWSMRPTGSAWLASNRCALDFRRGKDQLILIGMLGLEKRLARYPQFDSRIVFVHEFRPLGGAEMRQLLDRRWVPSSVNLRPQPRAEDALATVIRITSGNFRLLNRLLTQMERVLEVHGLHEITKTVIETGRETLVIGEA